MPQQFFLAAASKKVGDRQDLALRWAFLVQPRRVISREHLPMRAGAPWQPCNVVANIRVHHVVGGEVVVVEILDPFHHGLQAGRAHR
jgi:hypothetical protein